MTALLVHGALGTVPLGGSLKEGAPIANVIGVCCYAKGTSQCVPQLMMNAVQEQHVAVAVAGPHARTTSKRCQRTVALMLHPGPF